MINAAYRSVEPFVSGQLGAFVSHDFSGGSLLLCHQEASCPGEVQLSLHLIMNCQEFWPAPYSRSTLAGKNPSDLGLEGHR